MGIWINRCVDTWMHGYMDVCMSEIMKNKKVGERGRERERERERVCERHRDAAIRRVY
jgi:hypothetical protein